MARKTGRGSGIRGGISKPSISRIKNPTICKKLTHSNSRKVATKTSTRSSKKKRRRKTQLRDGKVDQNSSSKEGVSRSVSSKITETESSRVFIPAKEIENDMSGNCDRCTDGVRTKREFATAGEPAEKEPSATSAAEQDVDKDEKLLLPPPQPQPTTTTRSTNDFPKSWTEEMIRYYFEPNEERKNFDHVVIMNDIEYKDSDWRISDADRTECRKRKEFFLRCAKCNQKGHTKKECKKNVVCYVCGEFNHYFSQCPNALCLSCGRATKQYIDNCRRCRKIASSRQKCALCGQVWHEENLCPSKWRKYLTVTRTTSEAAMRLNRKKCCYNCAQQGHFGFECPLILQSDYPPENPLKTAFPLTPPQLQRYQDDASGDAAMDCDRSVVGLCTSENGENTPHSGASGNDKLDLAHVHVILLAKQTSDVLSSELGKRFLAQLSRSTNIRIELFCGKQPYVKLFGDDDVVDYCKCQLLKWKTS